MKNKKILILWISGLFLSIMFVLALHGKQTLALLGAEDRLVSAGTTGVVSVAVSGRTSGLRQEDVGVTNTGTTHCYVRMKVVMPNEEVTGSGADNCLVYDKNMDLWQDGGDGYYYYGKILSPGKTTEPLFDYIKYNKVPENASLDQLQVISYAEGIQSAYMELPSGPGAEIEAKAAFDRFKEQ